jgi:MYXO-CTERM domain-containing protein
MTRSSSCSPSPGRRAAALRFLLCVLALAFASLAPRAALAAGTVQIANTSPTENDGRWKLQMTINYGGTPHLAHVPMLFVFTPTVHYERALTDQSPERPILNRIPLQNQQSINESMDVGFSDGTGKIFAITKFDFVVRRDRGFEAGEYKLEIKRADDGVRMGNVITLKLQGDNPIIDRRAIVFAGDKKKEKKPEEGKAAGEGEKKGEGEQASGGTEPGAGEEAAATPSEGSGTPTEAPPAEPPKQGGCGCRVGSPVNDAASLAAVLLGAALLARRSRRRA